MQESDTIYDASTPVELLDPHIEDHQPFVTFPHNEKGRQMEVEYRHFEQDALKVLEEMEVVTQNEHGTFVCDLEKMRKFPTREFLEKMPDQANALSQKVIKTYGPNSGMLLTNLFWDRDVVAKGQEDEAPKRLIYIPETAKKALSIPVIQNTDFHLTFGDVCNMKPEYYPTLEDRWNSTVSMHEAEVMVLLFNQNRGKGERVETDDGDLRLFVTFPDGRRAPVSSDFFKGWGYVGSPNKLEGEEKALSLATPQKFVSERLPHLVSRGILVPEDFERTHGDEHLKLGSRKVGKSGTVFLENTAYTLGREYASDRVYKISDDTAAVVGKDGETSRIKGLFSTQVGLSARVEHWRDGGAWRVRKDDIYWEDPKEKSYDFKVQTALQFIPINEKLIVTGEDYSVLPFESQLALVEISEKMSSEKLIRYANEYGMAGVKALICAQTASGTTEAVEEIMERGNRDMNAVIFREIGKTFDLLDEKVGYKADNEGLAWKDAAYDKMTSILSAEVAILKGDKSFEETDIITSLHSFKMQISGMDMREYRELLKQYSDVNAHIGSREVALQQLTFYWYTQMNNELRLGQPFVDWVNKMNEDFYTGYEAMNKEATRTTGSARHLPDVITFVKDIRSTQENQVVTILDAGCGDGVRITGRVAEQFDDSVQIRAVDIAQPEEPERSNLTFVREDFTKLREEDNSFDGVYSVWSPMQDNLGIMQQASAIYGFHRVLKPGGQLFIECADLEGEGGNWQSEAEQYQRVHPGEAPYGRVETTFPGGFNKHLYIYPREQLEALLDHAGFENIVIEPWQTESGRARINVRASKKQV